MLLPISDHCINIANILGETELVIVWEGVAEWLLIAASVKSVDLDTIQHNSGFGYCSLADKFSISRDELLQKFVTNLAIFNFAWGALEATIKIINPPKHPDKSKRGKIRNACHYLNKKFGSQTSVLYLLEEVLEFKLAAQRCLGYDKVVNRFNEAGNINDPGTGLYAVYELRNSFAHGSLAFPMPDENNEPISDHANMISHAIRVILLSLQMLLIAFFDESDEPILFRPWSDSHNSEEFPLWLVLRGCHIERECEASQLSLFTNI